MSTGEFTIKFECQRKDQQDPMSDDYFGVIEVHLDNKKITKEVSHQHTAALEELLMEIIEKLPEEPNV